MFIHTLTLAVRSSVCVDTWRSDQVQKERNTRASFADDSLIDCNHSAGRDASRCRCTFIVFGSLAPKWMSRNRCPGDSVTNMVFFSILLPFLLLLSCLCVPVASEYPLISAPVADSFLALHLSLIKMSRGINKFQVVSARKRRKRLYSLVANSALEKQSNNKTSLFVQTQVDLVS